MVVINECLDIILGQRKVKIGGTELNEIILYSISNGWSRQAYYLGLYFKAVIFKQAINMFDNMEIPESIYEGVVQTSYKTKTTRAEATYYGNMTKTRGINFP